MYKCLLRADVIPGQHCTYAHTIWRHTSPSCIHNHDYHELFWVEEGAGYHWINGKKKELRPGMLILIRPEDEHGFSALPDNLLHITNLAFFSSSWLNIQKRYFQAKPIFFALKALEKREYFLDSAKMLELHQAARDLQDGARDLLTIERFLLNIFGLLQTHWPLVEQNNTPDWLFRACEEIRKLHNFEGGTLQFAKIAGRCPAHVARACKKYLNTTPTDIVNDARMIYAATRLLETDDAIVDIALDCGLENLGYFYRLFQAKFGFTPHTYRRHQRAALRPGHGLVIKVETEPGH